MILPLGIFIFALLAMLVFVPFAAKIDWQKNYRRQKNIELYQAQMDAHPSAELADELSQRLLTDEQALQESAPPKVKSAVKNTSVFSAFLWLILIGVPLAYYFSLNRFDAVKQGEQASADKQKQLQTATATERNTDYVTSVQNKLRKDPNDADAWMELGQAYALNNEFEHALVAYGNAERLRGSKPEILGLAATALYYQAGQKITPKVRQLIDAALQQDKYETSSLSLLASEAFLKTDYEQAIRYWQQLLDSGRQEVDRRKIIETMRMAEQLQKAKK
ncbi:c-type cytochrome biogenesis protein [Bisgaard Taxon 10/6]|uniref:c-type cytochrome biogenesis protein n=1 Tax=Exercitatus varius TaxID=67857 RepID=UPI00294B0A12|nr:c-type cytochrome biogenesis protein [Exercitatus varius]MDG2953874.1 c-type cytochrome biogenesis protein [Exercitatus varius]